MFKKYFLLFGKDNKKYFNFKDFNKPLEGNYINTFRKYK